MCKSRLELQFCCWIICCFFCILLYSIYDALSSDNLVVRIQTEMDIHIFNEKHDVDNSILRNAANLSILIGLSPHQCGSSYFHSLLTQHFNAAHVEYLPHVHVFDKQPIELRYWDRCMIPYYHYFANTDAAHNPNVRDEGACNFEAYLHRFISASSDLQQYNRCTLLESTPSYIRYYHTSYLLSHYVQLYDVKFYMLLRNPTQRTWLEYWTYFQFKYRQNESADVHQMIQHIDHDMDAFAHSYPKYQRMFDYIRISNESSEDFNVSLDEEKVVDLWMSATYDVLNNVDFQSFTSKQAINEMIEGRHSAFNTPLFAVSCYYPQILMWHRTFLNQSIELARFIKIIQLEWLHKDALQSHHTTVQHFLAWIGSAHESHHMPLRAHTGESDDQLKHMLKQNVGPVELLFERMDAFYRDCNVRLYGFLRKYPDLLLASNYEFEF